MHSNGDGRVKDQQQQQYVRATYNVDFGLRSRPTCQPGLAVALNGNAWVQNESRNFAIKLVDSVPVVYALVETVTTHYRDCRTA